MGWGDIKGNNSDKQELNFLSFVDGTTQVRVIDDEPFSRWTHWLPQANDGKGLSVTCIGKECPVCAEIKRAKATKETPKYSSRKMHALNVINRGTGEVNILDKGNKVFEQILGIREEMFEDYGDLINYDVKIRVSNAGTRDASYVIIPHLKKPLTSDEKALEKYNLEEVFPILTAEQVQTLMDGGSLTPDEEVQSDDTKETGNDNLNVDFTQQ